MAGADNCRQRLLDGHGSRPIQRNAGRRLKPAQIFGPCTAIVIATFSSRVNRSHRLIQGEDIVVLFALKLTFILIPRAVWILLLRQ